MADSDERPQGGDGFSLTKRYGPLPAWAWGLLGGAGVYAVYRFYQARKSAAGTTAATTGATGTDQTQIDYAPQIATLQAEIQQLQGQEATEPATDIDTDTDKTGGGPGGPPKPPGPGQQVHVPDVVGQRAAFAISTIEAAGLEAVTAPPRNPKREYSVTGQTPKAGSMVPKRTVVVLRVRLMTTPTPPKPRRPRTPAREISGGRVEGLR